MNAMDLPNRLSVIPGLQRRRIGRLILAQVERRPAETLDMRFT